MSASSSSEEISEKEKTAFDIIRTWFADSPTHGIRRISRANSIHGRLFWSFTFMIFTVLMCIFIYTIIIKFTGHPMKISLSVSQNRYADHVPTVTFCNLNPLRDQSFLNADKTHPTANCTDNECYNRFNNYMSGVLAEKTNDSQPTTVNLGYKLNELLIQCTFNGRSCNKNFTTFFHPNYGNCYTFNNSDDIDISGRKNVSRFWSVADENSGDGDKLLLELYLYQSEYNPYLDDRAGFRIFIHRKNEIPILSQNSLFVAPKTFTRLIYSQRIIMFAHQCRKDLTDGMKRIFNSNSVRYSQALCFKLCEFRIIEERCKCTDQLFMVFIQFFSGNRTQQIKTNQSCPIKHECLGDRTNFDSKTLCPECLPECERIQYTIQPSYADYPNMRSEDKVYQRIDQHLKSIGYVINQTNSTACVNNRKITILNDIVAVEISASPYATEILTESPMYTWVDLISSIGGQTGLWIGVSLISFVEIAELLVLLLCHFIKIIYGKIRKQFKRLGRQNSTHL